MTHWEIKKYKKPHRCNRCGEELRSYFIDYDLSGWLRIEGQSWLSFVLGHGDVDSGETGPRLPFSQRQSEGGSNLQQGWTLAIQSSPPQNAPISMRGVKKK